MLTPIGVIVIYGKVRSINVAQTASSGKSNSNIVAVNRHIFPDGTMHVVVPREIASCMLYAKLPCSILAVTSRLLSTKLPRFCRSLKSRLAKFANLERRTYRDLKARLSKFVRRICELPLGSRTKPT